MSGHPGPSAYDWSLLLLFVVLTLLFLSRIQRLEVVVLLQEGRQEGQNISAGPTDK